MNKTYELGAVMAAGGGGMAAGSAVLRMICRYTAFAGRWRSWGR